METLVATPRHGGVRGGLTTGDALIDHEVRGGRGASVRGERGRLQAPVRPP